MIREAMGYGDDITEAQEDARTKLGASGEDYVQFETITQPKKKVLGIFGGTKAQVRAYIETPDAKPKKSAKPKSEKPKAKTKENVQAKSTEQPKENKKAVDKKQSASVAEDYADAVDESQIPADSKAGKAIAYIRTVLKNLGCENVTIKAAVKENGAFVILDGEDLGVVIGHRGETLDALQYLTSLAANNGGGYFKVSINTGNYREKREQTLIALAKKVSGQVLKSGRSHALEPMNPYERRIIHTAVQDIEGVVSNSIGEGSGRRVVIAPEGGDMNPPKMRDSHSRNRRDKRPSNTVATAPTREPKKDSDTPLYGKIG